MNAIPLVEPYPPVHGYRPFAWRSFGAGCCVSAAVLASGWVLASAAADGRGWWASMTEAVLGATAAGGAEARGAEARGAEARAANRQSADLQSTARSDAALAAVERQHRAADPGRLVGPLARLQDAARTGVPMADRGTIRHRYRLLSYHVLAPLTGLAERAVTGGELVVVEDSDDDVATAVVYRFAPDGMVVASTPTGGLLGSFDPTTPAYRDGLAAASRQRIVVDGRE